MEQNTFLGGKIFVFIMFKTNFTRGNKIWGELPQKSPVATGLKCRLPNRISFDIFDRCFCKVETRACETPRICAKRLRGLAVPTLPGASRSFNPALHLTSDYIGTHRIKHAHDFYYNLNVSSGLVVCDRLNSVVCNNRLKLPVVTPHSGDCSTAADLTALQ